MLEPAFTKAGVPSPWLIHTLSITIAFSTITFLHIVLGEQAPKILAIRKAMPATLWVSRPLAFFYAIFKPAIWFLNVSSNFLLKALFRIEPMSEHELAHSEEELRVILAREREQR